MKNDSRGDVSILLSLLKQIPHSTDLKEEAVANLKEIANSSQWNLVAYKKFLWQQFLFADSIGEEDSKLDEFLLHFDFETEDAKEILLPLGLCLINKAKDNSELTEEDAQRYLNERTDAMLVLCDNYGYDGILIDYTGLSMLGNGC